MNNRAASGTNDYMIEEQALELGNEYQNYQNDEKLSIETEEAFCNKYAEQPSLNSIKDVNDSIKLSTLVENENTDGYQVHTDFKGIFDSNKYLKDEQFFENPKHKFMLRVPSRVAILNENVFAISLKLVKSKKYISENILIKLFSKNFTFSESMFQLSENEKNIILRRKKNLVDFSISIKLYYNNELIQERDLDLYERK